MKDILEGDVNEGPNMECEYYPCHSHHHKTVNSVTAHFILVEKVLLAVNGLKIRVYGVVKIVNGYIKIKLLNAYRPNYHRYSLT